MFNIININNTSPLEYEITHDGRKINFIIGKMINKRDKSELAPETQTALINGYLEYKGDEFKTKLMDLYIAADNAIMESITEQHVYPLPNKMVHDIINMFDLLDVFHYIKNVANIKPPSNLKETFDIAVQEAGLGTRVQTFIVDDYFELAAITIPLKAVLGPIASYGAVKANEISGLHREIILYTMIEDTHIANSAALAKVKGMAEKIIDVAMREKTNSAVTVIDKQIPIDDLSSHILATIALQKIAVANIVKDTHEENIITRIYHYINNKLKIKQDASHRINDKKPMSSDDGTSGSSAIESYKVQSEIALGFEVELDWAVSNIETIIPQLKVDIDNKDINIGLAAAHTVLSTSVTDEQVQILGTIFKGVIDPRGIKYVSVDSLHKMLGVGYGYLVALGFTDLGNILLSSCVVEEGDTLTINTSVNKTRIPQELKDELDTVYPYRRIINKDKTINIAEESINILANDLFSKKWYCSLTKTTDVIPNNIKVRLTEFILKNEGICHEYTK